MLFVLVSVVVGDYIFFKGNIGCFVSGYLGL